jgi:light-regulated signal transduction histidine kinase (bacteriophytochrome)
LSLIEDLENHFQKNNENDNLTIKTHLPDQPIKVIADKQQIFEILKEILTNKSEKHDSHQQVTIIIEKQPDLMVGISISNPDGFSDLLLQQIINDELPFTPEEHTKFASLGSNLPLIPELMAKNNGKIRIEKKSHIGTTLQLSLHVTE